MKLSIIILNWNTRDLTRQTLLSVFNETKNIAFEVIIVDNNSIDNSVDMFTKEFPQVKLIINQENLGFAKGNNIGMSAAQGEYIMLLNSDTIILDGAINKLVNYLDAHPDIMMVGPRLLNQDGTFQHACRRNLPDPMNSFFHLFGLTKIFKNSKTINKYKQQNINPEITGEAEALSGAAMMFRKKVYEEVGGLDEAFFMYGEDLDFCKRIVDKRWKIAYVSEAKITHLGGASAKKRKIKSIKNFYEAMWIYYKKHFKYNYFTDFCVWLGIKIRMVIALIMNLFKI